MTDWRYMVSHCQSTVSDNVEVACRAADTDNWCQYTYLHVVDSESVCAVSCRLALNHVSMSWIRCHVSMTAIDFGWADVVWILVFCQFSLAQQAGCRHTWLRGLEAEPIEHLWMSVWSILLSVSQGSVIGLILFILYVVEVFCIIASASVFL